MSVVIKDYDHFGRGIAFVDGKITFVLDGIKNEEVEIEITKETKKYNEAKIIKILNKSDKRITPVCKYYDVCGGCNLMHMSYDEEIFFKKEKVENILKRYANVDINVEIEKSNRYNYRNKITLHSDGKNMGYINNNKIVNIENCKIANDTINNYLNKNNYKSDKLIIRCNDNNEVISSVEKGYIYERINDYIFRIDVDSFFQVNNYITSKVFNYIDSLFDKSNCSLDLYSGVSTLGILISKKSDRVISIEENKSSYLNAKENIRINNINNITLINAKVEDVIDSINEKVDLIITDPPRKGMDKITISAIKRFKPNKVIYMSCDPMTMARDIKLLSDDYKLKSVKVFDMFVCTYHVESICVLERKQYKVMDNKLIG